MSARNRYKRDRRKARLANELNAFLGDPERLKAAMRRMQDDYDGTVARIHYGPPQAETTGKFPDDITMRELLDWLESRP